MSPEELQDPACPTCRRGECVPKSTEARLRSDLEEAREHLHNLLDALRLPIGREQIEDIRAAHEFLERLGGASGL